MYNVASSHARNHAGTDLANRGLGVTCRVREPCGSAAWTARSRVYPREVPHGGVHPPDMAPRGTHPPVLHPSHPWVPSMKHHSGIIGHSGITSENLHGPAAVPVFHSWVMHGLTGIDVYSLFYTVHSRSSGPAPVNQVGIKQGY